MQRLLAAAAALAVISGALPAAADGPGPQERFHVYLLIGQSNMAGRAPLSEAERGPLERVFLLNDADEWEVARQPFNRYASFEKWPDEKQKKGPGASFVRAMLAADPDIEIGLVVNARGDTSVHHWQAHEKTYKEALRRARIAARTGTIRGVLWNQGEYDRGRLAGFLEALKTLVGNLRADLGVPDLPFVAGGVLGLPHVNAELARLPAEMPGTGFASSEGLRGFDRHHFDGPSQKILGERYAREMLRLQRLRD